LEIAEFEVVLHFCLFVDVVVVVVVIFASRNKKRWYAVAPARRMRQ
jgi:hypothetical protein